MRTGVAFAAVTGGGDDQRRLRGFVEKHTLIADAAVFAELPAVIAVENDDRILPGVEPVQRSRRTST